MSNYARRCLATVIVSSALFSLQGCDQIQKLKEYLSPSQPPSQKEEPATQRPASAASGSSEAVRKEPAGFSKTEPGEPLAPNVLARVGSWSVTIDEFNRQLKALEDAGLEGFDITSGEQKRYILGELLQQQILVQAAVKENLDKDPDVLQAVKAFRDTLLVQAFVEKITEGMSVSDKEAEDFYRENQNEFRGPGQWRVREIVTDTEEKARAISQELKQGASFEELARTRSMAQTAARGGDLGFVETFEHEGMAQAVAPLEAGEVSEPFSGPQGYSIIKLEEKQDGSVVPLEEVREDLKNYILMMKRQQAVFEILAQAQEGLEITVNEQLLEE